MAGLCLLPRRWQAREGCGDRSAEPATPGRRRVSCSTVVRSCGAVTGSAASVSACASWRPRTSIQLRRASAMMPAPSTWAYFSNRNVPDAPPPAAARSVPRPPVLTITAAASAIGTSVASRLRPGCRSSKPRSSIALLDQCLAGALELARCRRRAMRQRRLGASLRLGAALIGEVASSCAATAGLADLPRRMARLAAEVAHQLLPEVRPSLGQLVALDRRSGCLPLFSGCGAAAAQARVAGSRCRGECGAASCASRG